jgi:hypothetical protein
MASKRRVTQVRFTSIYMDALKYQLFSDSAIKMTVIILEIFLCSRLTGTVESRHNASQPAGLSRHRLPNRIEIPPVVTNAGRDSIGLE